ncbi:MAG: arginine--tRNA ligase, partial [Thermoplasmata archaeon]|nr:arginine--tRNA ligase [Thermoplasmata archaeon]
MSYPLDLFKEEVKKEIISTVPSLKEINLETPPSPDKGDVAFACFSLSKILKQAPDKIAEEIASKIKTKEWIEDVTAERGYVNFFINREKLVATTIEIIRKMDESYGMLDKKNIKMIIEHTSANPNGPLHVGRARNPILEDTFVRLYKFAGYDVET